jgi:hypothetical protein
MDMLGLLTLGLLVFGEKITLKILRAHLGIWLQKLCADKITIVKWIILP